MKIIKIYLDWVYKKILLGEKKRASQIKEGEVYWCSLGENVGDEENGKGQDFERPVLIIKKFNNNIFWGIPMSTKNKDNKYYIKVLLKDVMQSVIVSQLRVLDSKRLVDKIGYLSKTDYNKVLKFVIGILHPPR